MADTSPVSSADRVLGGRYRLIRELASGGMGTVWRAEHLGLKKPIALKLLNTDFAGHKKALARLEREAQVLARMEHPHAVRVYDFAVDDGQPFLAMEFVEGITLEQLIAKGLPPVELATKILGQILEVLEVAHTAGIVHRDLKPANVMLTGEQHDFVKVVDFGIAALSEKENQPHLTEVGNIIGTAQYMSPEQIRAEPLDGRSDLYALGCVAFELLTGRSVFTSKSSADQFAAHMYRRPDSVRVIAPDRKISQALDEFVLRLLQKAPGSRFATAREASVALRDTATVVEARGSHPARPTDLMPEETPFVAGDGVLVSLVHDGTILSEFDMLRNALAVTGAAEVEPENAEVIVVCSGDSRAALKVAHDLLLRPRSAPVLICSTDDAVERFAEAVAMGVHDYISLPLEPARAVKRVISARRKPVKR